LSKTTWGDYKPYGGVVPISSTLQKRAGQDSAIETLAPANPWVGDRKKENIAMATQTGQALYKVGEKVKYVGKETGSFTRKRQYTIIAISLRTRTFTIRNDCGAPQGIQFGDPRFQVVTS